MAPSLLGTPGHDGVCQGWQRFLVTIYAFSCILWRIHIKWMKEWQTLSFNMNLFNGSRQGWSILSSLLFQNAIDPRLWCVKLNDYFGRARVPVPGRGGGGHMSGVLMTMIKTTFSEPGINLSQAKTSLFNELHSQGKNRGKTWLINHKTGVIIQIQLL